LGTQEEWWRTFFRGAMVNFWLGVTTAEQDRQEADFLEEALQVSPPAKLLDVPCGGGRHCRALAGRGYAMTGVDLSPQFLDAALSASAGQSGEIAWELREMRDLPWPGQFDGAYCVGNSFAYLDDSGNADFLKAVARTLRPGARFVLETGYVAEILFPSLQLRAWYPSGEKYLLADRRFDPSEGQLHVEYIFLWDSRIERRAMSARIYTYREVVWLLEEAGFTRIQGYSSLDRDPFRLGSSRLLLVATRDA
jgi:SAM-dependent methyltransferase